jgi:hypothetical protein
MTEAIVSVTASDTITVMEGFDAMRVFLMTVWQRHGKTPEDIAFVLGGSRWADGTPADPELWEDWLIAVRASKTSEGAQLTA